MRTSALLLILFLGRTSLGASPELILKEHWVDSDSIEKRSLLLNQNDLNSVNKAASVASKTRVYRYYVAKNKKKLLGYGIIVSQIVRTKTMALLYLVNTDWKIEKIEVLAFWEPPEYQPKNKWLRSLNQSDVSSPLRLKQDVKNITGATLSARAVIQNARVILQIIKLKLGREASAGTDHETGK